ncbi:structure-specific endonuclease subunit SLX1 [Tachypleus tridentatus]|uniref:structure-specific endonuclease subunit SLX1 n=1 Tax=Tachypleus tridentatus TaxID=6853 RepID=UPI003FD21264
MSEVENFYGCYILVSTNPKFKGRTYIGFTVDPNRRIQQHNKGMKAGGAWRTNNKGPWEMVLIVHGFPNEISALRFEWAWQHPLKSRRLRHVTSKARKETSFGYRFRVLSEMLRVGPWNRLPLTVRWLKEDSQIDFRADTLPPVHMPITVGPVKCIKTLSSREKVSDPKELEEIQPLDDESSDSDGNSEPDDISLSDDELSNSYNGNKPEEGLVLDDQPGTLFTADNTVKTLFINDQPSSYCAEELKTVSSTGSQPSSWCCVCHKELLTGEKIVNCLYPACSACSHMTCLANHFLASAGETDQIIPVEGDCPLCGEHVLWGDIIKHYFGCYQNPKLLGLPDEKDDSKHWAMDI